MGTRILSPMPSRDEQAPATKHRILIADDNRDSADSLAMYLERKGYEISTAYDGQQAIAAADAIRPDVVLLDIGMPKLNGYDVCRRIREQPWGKGTLMVAVTGFGPRDQLLTKAAGFDRHMVKPVEPAVLLELLASLPASPGDR